MIVKNSVYGFCLQTAKVMWIDVPAWNVFSLVYLREVVLFVALAYINARVKEQLAKSLFFLCSTLQNFDKTRQNDQHLLLA